MLVLSDGGGWKNIIMFDVWEVFVLGLMSGIISSGRMDLMDGRTNG